MNFSVINFLLFSHPFVVLGNRTMIKFVPSTTSRRKSSLILFKAASVLGKLCCANVIFVVLQIRKIVF